MSDDGNMNIKVDSFEAGCFLFLITLTICITVVVCVVVNRASGPTIDKSIDKMTPSMVQPEKAKNRDTEID
jgi:hypothetical protein